jgi:hypothetical protein
MMEVEQRRDRYAWRADRRHAGAGHGVQHPRGDAVTTPGIAST